jgi:hypothetical protein
MIADFVVVTGRHPDLVIQAKEQGFDYLEFPRGRTIADASDPSLTRSASRAGSVLTYHQRSPEAPMNDYHQAVKVLKRHHYTQIERDMSPSAIISMWGRARLVEQSDLLEEIAKGLATLDENDPSRQRYLDAQQGIADGLAAEWARLDLKLHRPSEPETITLNRLIADAKEQGYTEIYHVYRYRADNRLGPDRLPEATLHARNIDEAVKKLIVIAGYDEAEAELLGLDQFEAGTILELCDRLKELTGDTYSVSPYEMPHEP